MHEHTMSVDLSADIAIRPKFRNFYAKNYKLTYIKEGKRNSTGPYRNIYR
jgi:hypothetical protein